MKTLSELRAQPRRRFHVVLSRSFDLEAMESGAAADQNPRHAMRALMRDLDAVVYDPAEERPSLLDRCLGRLVATPQHWALARRLTRSLGKEDVVFALGAEGMSFPLLSMFRRARPAFALNLMSPDNRRMRLLLRSRLIARCVDLAVVSNEHKRGLVRDLTRVDTQRVFVLPEQTDTRFFRPGPDGSIARTSEDARPILFSPGLEQRDYRTLAEAVRGLDVEVVVCAMSPNAVQKSATFPDTLPSNMTVKPLAWPAFREAYQRAALVVVPLRDNLYSAGSTVVMEALACRRPVVITKIPGIATDLAARDLLVAVPPGDVAALRASIVRLLDQPELAEGYAERGHSAVLADHTLEHVMHQLAKRLAGLRSEVVPAVLAPRAPVPSVPSILVDHETAAAQAAPAA